MKITLYEVNEDGDLIGTQVVESHEESNSEYLFSLPKNSNPDWHWDLSIQKEHKD